MVDYKGQELVEKLFQWIIIAFGVDIHRTIRPLPLMPSVLYKAVGFLIGYVKQDFIHTFRAWLVGLVLSIIVS
jgi:hypothetical protein